MVALTDVFVGRGKWRVKLRLPALNDAKLLLAALVWPPSCYVSDATAKTGAPVIVLVKPGPAQIRIEPSYYRQPAP